MVHFLSTLCSDILDQSHYIAIPSLMESYIVHNLFVGWTSEKLLENLCKYTLAHLHAITMNESLKLFLPAYTFPDCFVL
jgi:hypothetical protein